MKTKEEIIEYLESELAKAFKMHNENHGKDAHLAFEGIFRATLLQQILDEIKN